MKTDYPIPAILKERPLDSRGFVIPYFVPIVDGKPDFRYQDEKKRAICLERMKCSVCSKELFRKSFWFISGPKGFENQTASDAPMHEDCARYSINVCPYLFYYKTDRGSTEDGKYMPEPFLDINKPQSIFLIKADKYGTVKYGSSSYIKFRTVYHEKYIYENNKLTRTE